MKLFEVAEYIPYDDSTTMKIAKQLYRASNGNVKKAKKMADGMRKDILQKIEDFDKLMKTRRVSRGREEFRPPSDSVPGYEEPGNTSSFHDVA